MFKAHGFAFETNDRYISPVSRLARSGGSDFWLDYVLEHMFGPIFCADHYIGSSSTLLVKRIYRSSRSLDYGNLAAYTAVTTIDSHFPHREGTVRKLV